MPNSSSNALPAALPVSSYRKLFLRIPALLMLACLLSGLSIFLLETVPQYIVLPVLPPDSYLGEWSNKQYAINGETFYKYFVFRREAVVSVDPSHDLETWQSIIDYFDEELSPLGWIRTDEYVPCWLFLPEARFLPSGQNGYVSYLNEERDGEFICLAVWNNEKTPDTYHLVLNTVKPSFFTMLISFFSM